MAERQAVRILVAIFIVASLITVSLAMLFVWPSENWPDGDLPAFESESQMREYLEQNQEDDGNDWSWTWWWDQGFTSTGESDGAYYTGTNVQVAGVDELDIVKTNGEQIFVCRWNGVSIIDATPSSSMRNISEINTTELIGNDSYASVQGIFLCGDILAIIIDQYENGAMYDIYDDAYSVDSFYYWYFDAIVTCCLVDVSDPTHPSLITSTSQSGDFTGARLIGENMYLISEEYAWQDGGVERPSVGTEGDMQDVDATSIRFDPDSEDANAFLNILALDLGSYESNFTSIVTGYSSVMYVSMDDLYITYVEYSSGDWTIDDSDATTTTIFRLSLDGLNVVPEAKGQVKGYPRDQFALDEKDGVLRMAVCTSSFNGESGVYTFDQGLNVIGSLTGLAPGETIQSVRFVGDMLYLVTFLQTDPLFIIDMSDATEPELLGELVVPGFSTYLHPCGNGTLVGIGLENWDLKISLFNVSDPTAPKEVDTLRSSLGASSEALWEHKAVLYDQGLLMIPVSVYNSTNYGRAQQVLVIQVDSDGLTVIEKLDVGTGYGSVRCVIIDDALYTVTTSSVIAWENGTYDKVGEVIIGPSEDHYQLED
ncbi:MAG: beta-propeller domain-containing protein [Methanomassiliicoccales archaeon]|nr:beta-propeller domain-containing protein [Methanomassiliicoccales archaeon]